MLRRLADPALEVVLLLELRALRRHQAEDDALARVDVGDAQLQVRTRGLAALPWSEAARSLQERVNFMHSVDAAWPDLGDEALLNSLDDWLLPMLGGAERAGLRDHDPGVRAQAAWVPQEPVLFSGTAAW